ncbi:MAG: arginyltransferase [Pseudomonadales bacterium]|jgi:arginyl-tRNA--protein-N-Asp/Glu arginylyltransferase|tara:strand:+ start:1761 stop:2486 length:726 start_codon:yes stop_codon:yes gene_type:complete
MTDLDALQFFQTPDHPCSYLPEQRATTVFADPDIIISTGLYTQLSQFGFRRSGAHIYRPHCGACQACIAVRLPVAAFTAKRRHQRVLKRNQDLAKQQTAPHNSEEIWSLYERYINHRHNDGDMYPADREQFVSFLVTGRPEAQFTEYRLGEQLIAVAVSDELQDGLSAIYTFFDPDHDPRSLGTFAILDLIQQTQAKGLPYLYLGYWIEASNKMHYKAEFLPQERLTTTGWQRISSILPLQ